MKTRTRQTLGGFVAALFALTSGALLMASNPASAVAPTGNSVTICHRTDSDKNPYVQETVDIASDGYLKAGHNDHTGPVYYVGIPKHTKWGDIIPPYTYQPQATKKNPNPVPFVYAGLNWSAEGQAIYNNGCKIPTPTPTPTPTETTPTPTPTETTPTPTPTETEESVTPTPTVSVPSETPTPTTTEPTPLCTEPNMAENLPCPSKYDTPTPTPTKTSATPVAVHPSSSPELGGCPVPLTNGKCVLPKTGGPNPFTASLSALSAIAAGISLMWAARKPGLHQ